MIVSWFSATSFCARSCIHLFEGLSRPFCVTTAMIMYILVVVTHARVLHKRPLSWTSIYKVVAQGKHAQFPLVLMTFQTIEAGSLPCIMSDVKQLLNGIDPAQVCIVAEAGSMSQWNGQTVI